MFGVNWWPVKNTRLSFDWVWNGFNNPIPFTGGNPLSSFNTLWFRYAMFFSRKKGAGRFWIDIGRRFGPTSDGRPT